MKMRALVACLAILPLAACNCCKPDAAGINNVKSVYFNAWTIKDGETFTTEKLSHAMSNSPDFYSIDDMAPGQIVDGWKAYSDLWTAGMKQFKTAQLTEVSTNRTWLGTDGAATASTVKITGTKTDGTKLEIPANVTLIYKRDNNQWRIVHENMNIPMPK